MKGFIDKSQSCEHVLSKENDNVAFKKNQTHKPQILHILKNVLHKQMY